MQVQIFQIDAFAEQHFGGNPAAVCPLAEWLPDETLQRIAAENNLSETAFSFVEAIFAYFGGSRQRSRSTFATWFVITASHAAEAETTIPCGA